MTETTFARLLTIKPLPEDVASGSHENTKVSTSSSKDEAEPSTLSTFTAEVTMGANLYAQWRKLGSGWLMTKPRCCPDGSGAH